MCIRDSFCNRSYLKEEEEKHEKNEKKGIERKNRKKEKEQKNMETDEMRWASVDSPFAQMLSQRKRAHWNSIYCKNELPHVLLFTESEWMHKQKQTKHITSNMTCVVLNRIWIACIHVSLVVLLMRCICRLFKGKKLKNISKENENESKWNEDPKINTKHHKTGFELVKVRLRQFCRVFGGISKKCDPVHRKHCSNRCFSNRMRTRNIFTFICRMPLRALQTFVRNWQWMQYVDVHPNIYTVGVSQLWLRMVNEWFNVHG